MHVLVRMMAPGYRVEPYTGTVTAFRPVSFRGARGRLDGIAVQVEATNRWQSRERAADRARVAVLGIIDLVLKWPQPSAWLTVETADEAVQRSHDISFLQPYEWADLLTRWQVMPRSLFTLSPSATERIDLLVSLALGGRVATLEPLLGPLAQVSAAAAAAHPFDRVGSLWAAIELLYPGTGDLQRIEALHSQWVDAEESRGENERAAVLLYGAELARDRWLHSAVRQRLNTWLTSAPSDARIATGTAYAIRCEIVHGQWARDRDDRRLEAGAAERWLWHLLDREIALRLAGRRLAPVRAISRVTVPAPVLEQ